MFNQKGAWQSPRARWWVARQGSERFAFLGRSHLLGRSYLSPDGESFTRTAPPLGGGWLRFAADQMNIC